MNEAALKLEATPERSGAARRPSKDDPSATYRGYRLQALYNLHRILVRDSDKPWVFIPEGSEDLEIRGASGQLLEVVQVKALTSPLTLSDLSPENPNKFFGRLQSYFDENPKVRIVLATFDRMGKELMAALASDGPDRDHVAGKIAAKNVGISLEKARKYLGCISWEQVDEATLRGALMARLKEIGPTGCDPESGFEILWSYIFIASETTAWLDVRQVRRKLEKVGSYLRARSAMYDVWQQNITPLPRDEPDKIQKTHLKSEYRKGYAARYEHIQAGLDVERPDLMAQIATRFEKEQVVIMHGISGSGKSTAAYRYLHNHYREDDVYLLEGISNQGCAARMSNALEPVLSQGVPLILYLDAKPSDTSWWHFLERLTPTKYPGVRVLVTIREEDFLRTRSDRNSLPIETLEVLLTRDEAISIYPFLQPQSCDFLNFDAAWHIFNESSPKNASLMEFAYLVNQGASLRRVLGDQISRLIAEDDDGKLVDFLRVFAVGSAYEARLSRISLLEGLGIKQSAFRKRLKNLESEYLIRVQGDMLLSIHPLRSQILAELLVDEFADEWITDVKLCLISMQETDLDFFLHMALLKHEAYRTSLLAILDNFQPKTWSGWAGVMRPLAWFGVYQYAETNRQTLDTAYEKLGIKAAYFLDWDLMELTPKGAADIWTILPKNGQDFVAELHERQTPKKHVFDPLRQWLEQSRPIPSTNENDQWQARTFVAGWLSFLSMDEVWLQLFGEHLETVMVSADPEQLAAFIATLPLENPNVQKWYRENENDLSRLLENMLGIVLEEESDTVKAQFPLCWEDVQAVLDRKNPRPVAIHERTLYVVDLLRQMFPNKTHFGSQGYGHRSILESVLNDEQENRLETVDDSYKNIPFASLPLKWQSSFNGFFVECAGKPYRPKDWREYSESVFDLRVSAVKFIEHFLTFLKRYISRKKPAPFPQEMIQEMDQIKPRLNLPPQLPGNIFDPWGYITEESPEKTNLTRLLPSSGKEFSRALALAPVVNLQKNWDSFANSVGNFLNQAFASILHFSVARDPRGQEQKLAYLASEGYSVENIQGSLQNLVQANRELLGMQYEFRKLENFLPDRTGLPVLEERESEALASLIAIWPRLVKNPRLNHHQIIKTSRNQLEHYRRRFVKAIQEKLRGLDSVNEVRICDSEANGQKLLVLIADYSDATAVVLGYESMFAAFADTITQEQNAEAFKGCIASWNRALIVPLWRGRLLENMGLFFEMGGMQPAVLQGRFYSYPMIPAEILEKLSLKIWTLPSLEPAKRFLEAARAYLLFVNYKKDLEKLFEISDRTMTGQLIPDLQAMSEAMNHELTQCLADLPQTEELETFRKVSEAMFLDYEPFMAATLIKIAFASALNADGKNAS